MLVLTRQLRGVEAVHLLSHSARAAVKLESVLPPSIRDQVGTVIRQLSASLGAVSRYEGPEEMFDELAEAIANRNVSRIVYDSFHEKKQITTNVHPYRMAFVRRGWYLIAHSVMHEQTRTFKLARIRDLKVTKRHFTASEDVDPESYFGDAWGMIPEGKRYNVHLWFSPRVAGNVAEVGWHHTQEIEFNDDGSIDFRVRVDGLGEIIWWILGYGDEVEVIAPAALRRKVAAVAESVAAKYRKEHR
ncbi:unnamed protein product [marine sediment metagenome]|uniref:Uncharacterized protein n=1 Tax=marine sediment metagenome TaxID=412755 RepID=X0XXJ2_9ZZZZ